MEMGEQTSKVPEAKQYNADDNDEEACRKSSDGQFLMVDERDGIFGIFSFKYRKQNDRKTDLLDRAPSHLIWTIGRSLLSTNV
jgi:hypothetical protein